MIIHKFIVHVLDKNSEVPILNDFEGKVSQEVDKFFQKIIKRVSKDDDLRKGVFKDYENNVVKNCCEQIIYDESTFLENSKEIAAYLFDVMKINAELESCDLAICLYTVKDEKYVGILKLDYKRLYTHSIEFIDDKFNIQMVPNEIGIPETQRQKQCAIVGLTGMNDEYHLRLLDKDAEKEELESKFINEFLNAEKIVDDKHKTKVFKNSAETWITNALANDIKQAEDVRSVLNYTLKEKEEIDLDDFVEKSIDNNDLKESFKEHMEEKGIGSAFNIDKQWVEKKLKKRSIKTDTGFDIKADLNDFEDPMKYSVKQNSDGSIDITIKNVKFYEEK
ncbi:nucleoid-associated protein [Paraclostridium sordellii]|uniref:Nucleoid-associated protein n=1 Tax=Paraclostridium sordellii TaxID=1505 RepID=A0A0C7QYT5_PARSO|nr:nucleoid-associated protein [Paeniclostridium sordellii]QYE98442.1 nucleoid-associated protein [Paeniclostridium sordellii]CEN79708.1 nucleoid-associated protein [[Clostridium] sordellii] [Paeniclostridium sordellii]CEO05325.1 nucleoid-associated protein [[Clostridium] sordellii] [Paeniclostridium sordellii]CEP86000.1 nucleoid-associated protein [[Clostridium] sordellii] [Paeniclostridium sordellii]CEP96252.1 nucleoid-associated protein [[Clostridium] sordellii] [Paeniclostridium sordellii]